VRIPLRAYSRYNHLGDNLTIWTKQYTYLSCGRDRVQGVLLDDRTREIIGNRDLGRDVRPDFCEEEQLRQVPKAPPGPRSGTLGLTVLAPPALNETREHSTDRKTK
jgi:hypothetical protein